SQPSSVSTKCYRACRRSSRRRTKSAPRLCASTASTSFPTRRRSPCCTSSCAASSSACGTQCSPSPGGLEPRGETVLAIAEERRIPIAGWLAPTPLPDVQATELGVGASTLEVPTDEIAEFYAELVLRA